MCVWIKDEIKRFLKKVSVMEQNVFACLLNTNIIFAYPLTFSSLLYKSYRTEL